MKNYRVRTIRDILKAYKKADNITRDQMWIRHDDLRKLFGEIDCCSDTQWRGPKIVPWAAWARKEKR